MYRAKIFQQQAVRQEEDQTHDAIHADVPAVQSYAVGTEDACEDEEGYAVHLGLHLFAVRMVLVPHPPLPARIQMQMLVRR